MGDDIILDITFQNQDETVLQAMAEALLSASIIYYTGVVSEKVKDIRFTVNLPGNNSEQHTHTHTLARPHTQEHVCACMLQWNT